MYRIKGKTVSPYSQSVRLIHRIGLPGIFIRMIDQELRTTIVERINVGVKQDIIHLVKNRHRKIFQGPLKISRLCYSRGIRFRYGSLDRNRVPVHVELEKTIVNGIDGVNFSARKIRGKILEGKFRVVYVGAVCGV